MQETLKKLEKEFEQIQKTFQKLAEDEIIDKAEIRNFLNFQDSLSAVIESFPGNYPKIPCDVIEVLETWKLWKMYIFKTFDKVYNEIQEPIAFSNIWIDLAHMEPERFRRIINFVIGNTNYSSISPNILKMVFPEDKNTEGTTFRESPYIDIKLFSSKFTENEYADVNLRYYYLNALNWSDSQGSKSHDWVAETKKYINNQLMQGTAKKRKIQPKNESTDLLQSFRELLYKKTGIDYNKMKITNQTADSISLFIHKDFQVTHTDKKNRIVNEIKNYEIFVACFKEIFNKNLYIQYV